MFGKQDEILEELECGIVLKGTEIKSVRQGKVSVQEAYCQAIRYNDQENHILRPQRQRHLGNGQAASLVAEGNRGQSVVGEGGDPRYPADGGTDGFSRERLRSGL